MSEPVSMPTMNKPPITYYHVGTILKTPKDVTYTLVNGTRKHLLNRNAFISGYSVLSAEGFRFLILPVQLTPFPVYPGLHVQM